jgi:DNA ligase-1
LIMETTFGIPKYRLPPSDEVIRDMVGFVREALEKGEVPMLAAYSLGKAQELIVAIHREAPEVKFLLHSSVAKMTEIYREYDYQLPEWRAFETKQEADFCGQLVIAPPSVLRSPQLSQVKKRRTAMISGWGIDPRAKYRYRVDHVFPLSDHADYDDLLDYVEKVDPKLVLTLHGFAAEFARDVRERGREAWSLVSLNQLELWVDSP